VGSGNSPKRGGKRKKSHRRGERRETEGGGSGLDSHLPLLLRFLTQPAKGKGPFRGEGGGRGEKGKETERSCVSFSECIVFSPAYPPCFDGKKKPPRRGNTKLLSAIIDAPKVSIRKKGKRKKKKKKKITYGREGRRKTDKGDAAVTGLFLGIETKKRGPKRGKRKREPSVRESSFFFFCSA